ncbi:hypothetical protein [Polyangium sp. 15x6]|uniref:hypothetical protein n=1 Tax=Polyangium sp. 15x6 TaxID=3042687 RepID=UPI00249C5B72|nr:hypothetical protein [Polyangium sp. 15x6]MDI3282144.1 hypothetical protein [Polyangium sp. 15x6]
MRRNRIFSLSFALVLATSTAAAAVKEPDGSTVPKASADPIQLSTFFANQGEPIDWQVDAAATPNTFSPLCGFTATFMLHGADCPLDFAWYNETGLPPTAADLHVIIPGGAPVGTSFSGTDIKNDPGYKGGLVGFALVGNPNQFCTQTHYSNPAWNQVCTGCNPAAPWITALIYPSKKAANAFYIGFEDGSTSAFSFNNDGDFNDAVYFVTGVTCAGGGQPCDTGKPGICASGITQCTAAGTTCQELSPAVPEKCNGFDDDCNGTADEGDLCQDGYVCDKGTCVEACSGGEFDCTTGLVCNSGGFCVEPACKEVTCPAGKVCVGGICKGPCDGVVCPYAQVCRVGTCVDPCAGVTCGDNQVCDAGVCVAKCECLPCVAGKACDIDSGLCLDPTCLGVICAEGAHCEAGACVDSCMGTNCPAGQACQLGQCKEVQGGVGGAGGSTGASFEVGGGPGHGGSGGTSATGGGTGATGQGGSGDSGSKSNCGCRMVGDVGGREIAFAGIALVLAAARRRTARKGDRSC